MTDGSVEIRSFAQKVGNFGAPKPLDDLSTGPAPDVFELVAMKQNTEGKRL